MRFITLDFETANRNRNSACELGLTIVEDNRIVETRSWLIRPYTLDFDPFNILVHGLTPQMVANQPEFPTIWEEVQPILNGQFLIAHNAGFDMSVLRRTLEHYSLPFPDINYACSYIFSKRLWENLPSYGLAELCVHHGITLEHHRAGPDSNATALLALKAFESVGLADLSEFTPKLQTTVGSLFVGGYRPSESKNNSSGFKQLSISSIVGDPSKHGPDSIFYGRSVVFTGKLSSMTRAEAEQTIADIGGRIARSVSSSTDFVVVGQQDYRVVGSSGMSSK